MADQRRSLPSVTALLDDPAVRALLDHTPRAVVVDAIRRTLDDARGSARPPTEEARDWAATVREQVANATRPSLRPVLNGTGVVLHTNLGRAPLAEAAIDAIGRVARGFTNLEYDLERGARGSRYVHCAALLRELTGAEDALVVNNGAAGLVLALNTFAYGRGAIVSRGELVEIGGSFRIPEIMEKSGARLVEVGTTNRTKLEDYRKAASGDAATGVGAIVKVHRSNFAISGFVAEAESSELGTLATELGVALVHDLGSGLLLSLEAYGLSGEPTARDAVAAAGAHGVIVMSGDKLLGGPQAGIILGARATLERVRTNPLTRSYRVDKLTLAALEATLALYRDPGRALREIPALVQLTTSAAALRERATAICAMVGTERVKVVDTEATVGGGAFPTARMPSAGIAVHGNAAAIEAALRLGDPPVIARVAGGSVIVDVRAIAPTDDDRLAAALRGAL